MFTRKAARRFLASVVAAAGLAAAVLSTTVLSGVAHAADATGRRVTGGGQYTSPRFGQTTVTVHAIRHGDGTVTGQLEQHSPDIGLSVHGEVDCLFVVGNTAYVSGIITDVQRRPDTGTGSNVQEGLFFILAVEDNEQEDYFLPDRVSPTHLSATPIDCENPVAQRIPTLSLAELTAGNFQVVP